MTSAAAAAIAAIRGAMPLPCLDLGNAPGGPLSEGIKLSALRALRATTPGWRDAENDPKRREEITAGFTMRTLTGGMTNAVFRCSKPGGDNQTVLLRVYGKGTEMFFKREDELRAFKILAGQGFGPQLLATLGNGRVEQFLEGKALGAEDLRKPSISALIARQLFKLHGLNIDTGDRSPVLFRALKDFHQKALELCGKAHGGVDVVELGELAAALRERLEGDVPSKVVFCHNDLQCGNIMYNEGRSSSAAESSPRPTATASCASLCEDTSDLPPPPGRSCRSVSLIDYEYSGHNPRGFDVGNHFCEWMADYSTAQPHVLDLERYPSAEERRLFCRAYLGAMNGVPDDSVGADEVEALVSEADAYSLASHLLWAMWALLQSKSDAAAPGFDYLKYAAERIRAYRWFAERLLPPLPPPPAAAVHPKQGR
ncbi:unnamed protein product [Scytosiphon promiscuus]